MSLKWEFPYVSQRMPVLAKNIVATSQPLAAQAGLQMLANGGNAADAALAAAITLTVVEPTSNGIGSDAFAIVWDGQSLQGINGSGYAPAGISVDQFTGQESIPQLGWSAVTVPGAVSTWAMLWKRFGKLGFTQLFEPAIRYAREGFLVSPKTAYHWAMAPIRFAEYPEFLKTFLPDGLSPSPGQLFKCEDQAITLEKIASTRGESFYRGELSDRIVSHASETGGYLTENDLAGYSAEWVDTISQEFQGVHLHEIPPNGQGLAALIALGILDVLNVHQYWMDSVESIHLQIEAMKIAFAEAHAHIAEPASMKVSPHELLDKNYLADRARSISMNKAGSPVPVFPKSGGTVYLAAADDTGMMVSFIQSNYMGFGSGIVIPGTGISMQNRGCGFALDPGHPNCIAPGKRPYQTIIPGFVMRGNVPVMSFGVMGGHMQPQGHLQMMVRIFGYGQNPQAASDAPRWYVSQNHQVAVEPGFDPKVITGLEKRGHMIIPNMHESIFGGAQLIYKMNDAYCGASDHRKDGQAQGF